MNFKNLTQLLDAFKDEEKCKAYLEKQRWETHVACPHCGSLKVYRTNRGFKCGEKECYKKFSVTVGTIFENSKIPLVNNFRLYRIYDTKPQHLVEYNKILDYQVYHSTFNEAMYIVHDHINDKYYAFENEGSTDIDNDLAWAIRAAIIPLT